LLTVREGVAAAAIKGAREAGKGADLTETSVVVRSVLNKYGTNLANNAVVRLEDPGTPARSGVAPDPPPFTCDAPASDLSVGNVRVTVCVELTSSNIPIIGQLGNFGLSLVGKIMCRSAVVKKECTSV
jgi:hypothetical protein